MPDIQAVADSADIIVNGYAFTKYENGCKILNLNHADKALLLSNTGDVLETSMDDIEIQIVKDYYQNNRQFMEDR